MDINGLGRDISEFGKTLVWYTRRKLSLSGAVFETGKGFLVEVLKARRGTYQKPFLHVGMVFLTITAVMSAPIIANSYPTRANALESQSPSTVLNSATDVSGMDTQTTESQKPRRDVVSYTVKGGDTLSSIAKTYGVDTTSIAYLNDTSENKLLQPGDVIKIPPVAGIIVKVKSGDTIASLAKKYGLPSPQPIVDWPYNSFANDETFALSAGQQLVIPNGKPPEVAPAAVFSTPSTGIFTRGSGQFSWPTNGIITQYFSWYHNGVDIANNIGTPILAADSGRVVSVLYQNHDYGFHVIIDHGNGYRTLYGHMSEIWVNVGDNVSRGQQIGKMGSTGRSTGSHLHFTVYLGGTAVNPLGLLR